MAAAPADLRVLCRRLASTPADDLPRLCPLLVSHVLRCGGPLSASPDAGKGKDKGSETPMLVHKLRTHITTLLNGKSPAGRFAAVCLIKAVVDVGGWESLRASAAWIRGMIGVVQKPLDPLASKELAVITLTKIYMLLQGYPTLIREMATPTLPSFVTACLSLIKAPASSKAPKAPASFIETVACSLSKLVKLYPTTLRPFTGQIKSALREYIAPTSSESHTVPQSLKQASRRLYILLSYTAPKNTSSAEWVKSIKAAILDCHTTADQIFRAVLESWESTTGYRGEPVRNDLDPSGGGDSDEEFPSWVGVHAGSERLIGLLDFLGEYLDNPTKDAVTVPVGELLDLTSRLTLVAASEDSSSSIQTNPAIGRDEKADLWTAIPDIHAAVLRLHTAAIRRLETSALPLATDILDHTVRVLNASRPLPFIRETAYTLAASVLSLAGPTLPRLTVDSLAPLIQSTCSDILLSSGHLSPSSPSSDTPTPGQTKNKPTTSTNADAFLTQSSSGSALFPALAKSHLESATALLPLLLSHLPQNHLSPDLRGLLDRTAILSNNKKALVASVLHPYKDSRGRFYPSILPFLVRQFGTDQDVEVLRSNLVRAGKHAQVTGEWDPSEGLEGLLVASNDDDDSNKDGQDDEEMADEEEIVNAVVVEEEKTTNKKVVSGWGVVEEKMDRDEKPAAVNPFAVAVVGEKKEAVTVKNGDKKTEVVKRVTRSSTRAASPLKRKSDEIVEEEEDVTPAKRVDVKKTEEVVVAKKIEKDGEEEEDSDSEGSVQIDMSLDDDDDEEDEDEDDE
ncbi:rRNA processing/ribosome biogenesis-domain-containing protein [Podospora australis]|uniref:Pre-rRNA-processing protein RIX1 n=1 Tax=Podospora australis TaxID=1536484 RepID=A0AAN6WRS3_9PEZI|nr:rRNA processing/ribosome biogenesis-domain-containing protein [Podospora australis]